jgi:hypothetical protein
MSSPHPGSRFAFADPPRHSLRSRGGVMLSPEWATLLTPPHGKIDKSQYPHVPRYCAEISQIAAPRFLHLPVPVLLNLKYLLAGV